MSRKVNSPDNGMMESFFGILKSEMFYGYEKMFHLLEQLEQAIVDYIDCLLYTSTSSVSNALRALRSVEGKSMIPASLRSSGDIE